MKLNQTLLRKRQVLLERMARLSWLVHGSYLERFSVCTRPQCACRRGQRHGPRSYVVVYRGKKQRQVYVPQAQREAIRQGIRQDQQLRALVQEITRLNLQLMRAGALLASAPPLRKKGARHE